jgi:mRNA interferase MazF
VTIVPGDVYVADIFEGGTRPVIIVSREQLNRGGLYLAVPVTAARVEERRRYANYVFLPAGAGGLRDDSVAVTHLVQPVRSGMLREKWGQLSQALMQQVLVGIAWSIDLVK